MRSFTERILWRRAKAYLKYYHPLLIGVTGTSGAKLASHALALTLTEERHLSPHRQLAADATGIAEAILGVAKTSANWYQLLTRSLVRELTESEPDTFILELGVERPGDMDFLATELPFKIGVVTDIGTKNTELFGSVEGVAHEHASLIASLSAEGHAIVNADQPLVVSMAEHTNAEIITFGTSRAADVYVERLERLPRSGFAGEVNVAGRPYEIHLPHLVSRQQVTYILPALAVAHLLELNLADAISRLQTITVPRGHVAMITGLEQCTILDASLGATPESTMVALETIRALARGQQKRRVAILGDMTNLGRASQPSHRRIGKFAGEVAEVVIVVGSSMRAAGAEAMSVGADVHHFEAAEDVGKWLPGFIGPDDIVLVTGSPEMHMEKIVERLGGVYEKR